MKKYNCNDIKCIVQAILDKKVSVLPVGNHHLERNLVHYIKYCDECSSIFKLFLKKNRWNREVAALHLLAGSNIKCPELLDYGRLDDGTEWLMTDFFDGYSFDQTMSIISEANKKDIYIDMGRELGKIHSLRNFDFFGNWDEKGNSIEGIKDYYVYFSRHIDSIIKELDDQILPDKLLLNEAIKKLQDEINIIRCVKKSSLCHNDFSERNIIVKKTDEIWKLEAIIDFEQSLPSDKDRDLAYICYKLACNNPEYEKSFLQGYKEFCYIDEDYYKKKDFYLLYFGLYICSWAYNQAPDHYMEGLKLLKEFVK